MSLRQYTTSVDGSIPVQALLYNDEDLLSSQDSVGIYDGPQKKSPEHQNGTVSVTTHRLFYIDATNQVSKSFALDLSYISQTEYYAGLFTSSPKVTCHLVGAPIRVSAESDARFESWECEVCAYRNPPGLSPAAARICALCGVPRLKVEPRSAPSSRPFTPEPDLDDVPKLIRLSFRKGGDKPFYTVLKSSLKNKSWEGNRTDSSNPMLASSSGTNNRSATATPGISGILRTVESTTQEREKNMKSALQDMEGLMLKAKDMVALAAELNEKLTAAASSSRNNNNNSNSSSSSSPSFLSPLLSSRFPAAKEPEDATFVRSSLSQLGLQMTNAPVTIDMMKDERKWLEELAKELGRVLQGQNGVVASGSGRGGGLMRDRGIVALDEVWGGWNRSRGVALLPPSTFLQVIPLLSTYTDPPIRHRAFASGLNVLHTPPYSHASFATRLSKYVRERGPKTTLEIADFENDLPVGLVAEMVDAAEADGWICRDDSKAAIVGGGSGTGSEVRWWDNIFEGYRWDGHGQESI